MINPLHILNIDFNELYDEDIIIDLRNHMNNLKGNILMDSKNSLFIFEDFEIESVTHMKGLFRKKEVTEFYIKWIKLSSEGILIFKDDNHVCSMYGVETLMSCRERWLELQSNLIKLSTTTGMTLNFSTNT